MQVITDVVARTEEFNMKGQENLAKTAVSVDEKPTGLALHEQIYDWAVTQGHITDVGSNHQSEHFVSQWGERIFESCYRLIVEYMKRTDDFEIGKANAAWINMIRSGEFVPE